MFLNGWCPRANVPLVCPFQFESEKAEDRFKFQLTIQTNLLSSRCWCASLASNFSFSFFFSFQSKSALKIKLTHKCSRQGKQNCCVIEVDNFSYCITALQRYISRRDLVLLFEGNFNKNNVSSVQTITKSTIFDSECGNMSATLSGLSKAGNLHIECVHLNQITQFPPVSWKINLLFPPCEKQFLLTLLFSLKMCGDTAARVHYLCQGDAFVRVYLAAALDKDLEKRKKTAKRETYWQIPPFELACYPCWTACNSPLHFFFLFIWSDPIVLTLYLDGRRSQADSFNLFCAKLK